MPAPPKKSGFVTLVGRSNVGKSTLLNALVGSKVAIVTPKPQTTREPIRGILHDRRGQIVFVDTPGIFLGKKDPVSLRLNQRVEEQLEGIDAIIYVVDPTRAPGPEEEKIQTRLRATTIPLVLVINKIDQKELNLPFLDMAHAIDVGQRTTIELSALAHKNLNQLVDALFALLKPGDLFYPEGQLTDLRHKEWLEELIREKAFLRLSQELPYTLKVEVTEDAVRPHGHRFVAATIWTSHERYQKMIIGAKAKTIKQIGMDARKELEAATDQKYYLELTVRVDSNWPQKF